MEIVLLIVAGCVLLYAAAVFVAAWVSVHPPRIPVVLSPALLGLPQERVALDLPDGRTARGWWVPGGKGLAVVCVHGYLMNRAEFVPLLPLMREAGASCLLLDLRGHGSSSRGPVTFGVRETAEVAAAAQYARARLPGCRVVLFGSSMGAAAACRALADDPALADALIADSMYSGLDEAAAGWWTFFLNGRLAPLFRPVNRVGAWITGIRPSQVSTLPGLAALRDRPVLLLFGEHDPLVPPDSRLRMESASGGDTSVAVIPDGNHGDGRLRDPVAYRAAVEAFLARVASSEPIRPQ